LDFTRAGVHCPIHVKVAPEVERRRHRGGGVRGGGCASSQKISVFLISKWWVFNIYAFPGIFIDTVTANRYKRKLTLACFEHIFFFKKGHPKSKGRVSGHPWIRH